MAKKSIKPRSAKNKGARGQKIVAERISQALNIPWGKDELIASREMGQSGTDIRLIGEALKLFPYAVEVKNCEKVSLPAWIRQAKTNQTDNTDWLVVWKKNQMKPVVVLDMEAFFTLFEKTLDQKNE